MGKPIEKLVIQFDSSAALLKSLALYYKNLDFRGGGVSPDVPSWVGHLVNSIPRPLRQAFYSWSGWFDALDPHEIENIDPEAISQWVTNLYPPQDYRGIVFGASNGAAIHLAAALGMAWLPQTYLIAARRLMHPDLIHKDIAWGQRTITPYLKRYPLIHAAQMHDPVQDRLMVSKMGYFRLKMLGLSPSFEKFISESINNQKPLITINCTYQWPSLQVGERHSFQLGGFGDIDPYEYLRGSERTRSFLKKMKAKHTHWETFKPTGETPESEWGFYPQINSDLKRVANVKGAPFYRLTFNHPEGLSEFACDLYQWWYQKRLGKVSQKILIENFALMAPYRIVKSGALPFWLAFNTQNSADRITQYLNQRQPFNDLYLMLMSNGVTEGIGLTSIESWKEILRKAKNQGHFIGVDEKEYPLDFATFMRYYDELIQRLPDDQPIPEPLSIAELQDFLQQSPYKYPLKLEIS